MAFTVDAVSAQAASRCCITAMSNASHLLIKDGQGQGHIHVALSRTACVFPLAFSCQPAGRSVLSDVGTARSVIRHGTDCGHTHRKLHSIGPDTSLIQGCVGVGVHHPSCPIAPPNPQQKYHDDHCPKLSRLAVLLSFWPSMCVDGLVCHCQSTATQFSTTT